MNIAVALLVGMLSASNIARAKDGGVDAKKPDLKNQLVLTLRAEYEEEKLDKWAQPGEFLKPLSQADPSDLNVILDDNVAISMMIGISVQNRSFKYYIHTDCLQDAGLVIADMRLINTWVLSGTAQTPDENAAAKIIEKASLKIDKKFKRTLIEAAREVLSVQREEEAKQARESREKMLQGLFNRVKQCAETQSQCW